MMNKKKAIDVKKKCNFCNSEEDQPVALGGLITKNITVHYYCMLLSTNLLQRGSSDSSGILGFLLSDIQKEIENASKRVCYYCGLKGASVACHVCKIYFHVKCGHEYSCVTEFVDEFHSYCHIHHKLKKKISGWNCRTPCSICNISMGFYDEVKCLHAKCCGNGYVHLDCMREYALEAGYYLRCIWCRSPAFREMVKYQSVFVPDREAKWEFDKSWFADLHKGHFRCDADLCLCPSGRSHQSRKWPIIVCILCGSFGVHNPYCFPKQERIPENFYICETCSKVTYRHKNKSRNQVEKGLNDDLDYTMYLPKSFVEVESILKNDLCDDGNAASCSAQGMVDEEISKNAEESAIPSTSRKRVHFFIDDNRQTAFGTQLTDQNIPTLKGRTVEDIEESEISESVLDIVEGTNDCSSQNIDDRLPKENSEAISAENNEVVSGHKEANKSSTQCLPQGKMNGNISRNVEELPPNIVFKEVYFFNSDNRQTGRGTALIDLNDSRLKGRSLEDIKDLEIGEFILGIVEQTNDCPLQDLADRLAKEYLESRNAKVFEVESSDEEAEKSPTKMLDLI